MGCGGPRGCWCGREAEAQGRLPGAGDGTGGGSGSASARGPRAFVPPEEPRPEPLTRHLRLFSSTFTNSHARSGRFFCCCSVSFPFTYFAVCFVSDLRSWLSWCPSWPISPVTSGWALGRRARWTPRTWRVWFVSQLTRPTSQTQRNARLITQTGLLRPLLPAFVSRRVVFSSLPSLGGVWKRFGRGSVLCFEVAGSRRRSQGARVPSV